MTTTMPIDAGLEGPVESPLSRDGGSTVPSADGGPQRPSSADAGPDTACAPVVTAAPAAASHASCSGSIEDCLTAAESAEEEDACWAVEEPDCRTCVIDGIWHCASSRSCSEELGAVECCVSEACAEGDGACVESAIEGTCRGSWDVYQDCLWNVLQRRECPLVDPMCLANDGSTTGGGSTGGGTGAGSSGASTDCTGTASVAGSRSGTSISFRYAYSRNDNGGIGVILTEQPIESLPAGAMTMVTRLTPIAGQSSYPPTSQLFRCGLVRYDGSSFVPVEEGLCEINVSTLQYASAAGTCDGRFVGVMRALFGTEPIAGAIDAPLVVAESEVSGPSCRPRDAACSDHSECCSGSCWWAVGVCH